MTRFGTLVLLLTVISVGLGVAQVVGSFKPEKDEPQPSSR